MTYTFPFGSKLSSVQQSDRTPKQLFVLGVYASAVHAQWLDANGKTLVKALAVASEPNIFWRGEDVERIISEVEVPAEAGRLEPAGKGLNGPSGIALDERFLHPLGHDRSNTWLCDLLPESRMNPSQAKAIERCYRPRMAQFGLPEPTIPAFQKSESDTDKRREEILDELKASSARRIVVLGDIPIQQFIRPLSPDHPRNLSHLGELAGGYGRPWTTSLNGYEVEVIGLCHPRQAARLGRSSGKWGAAHDAWMKGAIPTP
ncbi:MAG: hypothetical protein KDC03_23765 [Flavobacteriales bacterium]|nr:hypothetical protein [Flavobacteriales bacterium]